MKNIIIFFSILLCLNLCAGTFRTYKQACQSGDYKLRQRQYGEAVKDLLEALSMAETEAEKSLVLLKIGHAYFGEADYKQAREMYSQVLVIEKGSSRDKTEALMKTAESYLMGKKYPEALASFENILEEKSITTLAKADIMARISQIYMAEKDYSKQRETLEKIIGMEEPLPVNKMRAMLQMGDSFTAEKKYEEALETFNRILETPYASPHSRVDSLIKIGIIHEQNNRYEEALACYARVIEMGKDAPDWLFRRALLNLAGAYRKTGRFDKAREAYNMVIAVIETPGNIYAAPTKLTAMLGIADSYREEGREPEARTVYEQALEQRGITSLSEQQVKKVESIIGENEPAGIIRKAEGVFYEGRFSGAREEYSRVSGMEEANVRQKTYAQMRIGDTYSAEKKYPEAKAEYLKVLKVKIIYSREIERYRINAQKSIADICRTEGDFEAAKAGYAKILKMEGISKKEAEETEERIDSIYW